MRVVCALVGVAVLLWLCPVPAAVQEPARAPTPAERLAAAGLEFIDTGFENASPLWYEVDAEGLVQIHLVYDHERASPNRANGHWHFRLHGRPGAKLGLVINNLENIYNGRAGSPANEKTISFLSTDARNWTPTPMKLLPGNRLRLDVELRTGSLYVVRLEPYRISDLDTFLAEARKDPLVRISPIGRTVEGRSLEILRVGRESAPHRVFLRARAHPWEPGGNWVIQGLVRRLLRRDAEARRCLDRVCFYILPMANKDGVARGRTRFNLRGKDLNRDWGRPADPELCPENAALEAWLAGMIRKGRKPDIALELHNDDSGRLHLSRPAGIDHSGYLDRMRRFEGLLREHTWFREGTTGATFTNPGTLGEGWLVRFGIDAAVHELNANWIAGLDDYPSGRNWELYGSQWVRVFARFFEG